jgi:hypothetical protein
MICRASLPLSLFAGKFVLDILFSCRSPDGSCAAAKNTAYYDPCYAKEKPSDYCTYNRATNGDSAFCKPRPKSSNGPAKKTHEPG